MVNVAVLVVFMDGMVLSAALPRIQQELQASQSEQEWAIAAYTLVFAVLLLPSGLVGDRFGRRHLLTGGLALFGAGSWAAAYSWSPLALGRHGNWSGGNSARDIVCHHPELR